MEKKDWTDTLPRVVFWFFHFIGILLTTIRLTLISLFVWLTGEPGSGLREWATPKKWATWATAKKWAYVGVGVGLRLVPQDLHQQCTTAQGQPRRSAVLQSH